jgi:hypothetical protein
MYGKHFKSMYTGSMFGAGPVVFAVWGYAISHRHFITNTIELHPIMLAAAIGCEQKDINDAIDYLCSPDPQSRSKAEGGRRLIKTGEYLYLVVNGPTYSGMRNEDERREYNRKRMNSLRKTRAAVAACSGDVAACSGDVAACSSECVPLCAHVDVDVDVDVDTKKKLLRPAPPDYSPEFLCFYETYPRHESKRDAWKAWGQTTKSRPPTDELVAILRRQIISNNWIPERREFTPLPATYLRGERWTDEIKLMETAQTRMQVEDKLRHKIETERLILRADPDRSGPRAPLGEPVDFDDYARDVLYHQFPGGYSVWKAIKGGRAEI